MYKIKYALKKKQIPDAFIQASLENLDPDENREQLRQLLERKRQSVNGKNELEIRQKLMRFAVGRGFSIEAVEKELSLFRNS
jgi:regulatory protein